MSNLYVMSVDVLDAMQLHYVLNVNSSDESVLGPFAEVTSSEGNLTAGMIYSEWLQDV